MFGANFVKGDVISEPDGMPSVSFYQFYINCSVKEHSVFLFCISVQCILKAPY